MSGPLGILDDIAQEIADAISPPSPTLPVTPEPPLKPLVYGDVPKDMAVAVGRGLGDLDRYLLPGFVSPHDGSLISGASNRTLQHLGRTVGDSLRVTFPDPIYGIWLDPSWTTPGAQVGIAFSGSSRGNFTMLTRGKGIRFSTPVTEIRIMNMDGFEQVFLYPDPLANTTYPLGYASFLVALNPGASYEGEISTAVVNVSPVLIPPVGYNNSSIPSDGLGRSAQGSIPSGNLREIYYDILGFNGTVAATNGWGATFQPWFLTAFQKDGIPAVSLDITTIDMFSAQFGARWTPGNLFSVSCLRKGTPAAADQGRNQGARIRVRIPPGTLATYLGLLTNPISEMERGATPGDLDRLLIVAYGVQA